MSETMKTELFIITALENIHAGSGDESYGIIDNQVQKDKITDYPVIHSSSLKGALREFFNFTCRDDEEKIIDIFGSKANAEDNEKQQSKPGYLRFFTANLLSFPVRSNKKPFFRATSPDIIQSFIEKVKLYSTGTDINGLDEIHKKCNNIELPAIFEDAEKVIIEDFKVNKKKIDIKNTVVLNKIFGKDIAVFNTEQFKMLMEDLPVIARNQLNNGESQNLWYEEIVPRESRFYFFVSYPSIKQDRFNEFYDEIKDKVVQIGANATVGYGYCTIKKPGDC